MTVACRVLGFSKQAFYKWHASPICARDWDDAHLINLVMDIHHDDPAFGYRFITDELARRGLRAGENRVWRLCAVQGIWSVLAKRRGLVRTAGPPVHDDLVGRKFAATAVNRLLSRPTSPSTRPVRESSTCVRSKMSIPVASSATRSTRA